MRTAALRPFTAFTTGVLRRFLLPSAGAALNAYGRAGFARMSAARVWGVRGGRRSSWDGASRAWFGGTDQTRPSHAPPCLASFGMRGAPRGHRIPALRIAPKMAPRPRLTVGPTIRRPRTREART